MQNIIKITANLNPVRIVKLITLKRVERFIYYIRARQYRIVFDRIKRLLLPRNKKKIALELVGPQEMSVRREFNQYMSPMVSIIVPVFNKWEHTHSCLTAIYMHTGGIPYEVILADDASSDETRNIEKYFSNIRVNLNSKNLGFLLNCNAAAQCARGKYLVFLNNDTNVQDEWLKHLLDTAESDEQVGLVGPMLLYPNGRLQEAGGIIWSNGEGWNYGCQDDHPERSEYNYFKEVDYISGACILVRREIWNKLKGFDERFAPAYYEDTDLAFGVRKLGYKVVYQPKSRVIHFEGISHGKDMSSGVKQYQKENRYKFELKWREILRTNHCTGPKELFAARDRSVAKKILLFIDHYVPMPDRDAGSRSTFQYLKLLTEMGYSVKFIGDDYVDYQPYTSVLQGWGIEVLYGEWYQRNWKKWICNNGKYIDYVYFSRPEITRKYLRFIKDHTSAKFIYSGHDLRYLREARRYEVERKIVDLKESRKWEKIEKSIVTSVDVSYFFSDFEVNELKKCIPESNIKSIPLFLFGENGKEETAALPGFENRRGLLFVGGFMHAPNLDAVVWFIKEIFPLIHDVDPGIEFNVVGSNPPAELLDLAADKINILGEVSDDDLRKLYQEIRIVVAPLRFGAGVKGKILESMGCGVPVVTTSIGAEGIHEAENALLIADDPQLFSKHIIQLYNDAVAWSRSVEQGEKVLGKYYTKDCARKILYQDMPTAQVN